MASPLTDTFGFELLYNISRNNIEKNSDVIILFIHWYITKNGFKCLGCGDAKTISPSEVASELLPDGWSRESNYSLRYVKDEKLYILLGVKSDNDLILNLLKVEDHSLSSVQLSIDSVKVLDGPLIALMPDYEEILNSVKNNLMNPVNNSSRTETSTQTSESQPSSIRDNNNDPLRVGPRQRPPRDLPGHDRPGLPFNDPLNVGRNDLDPLGVGRGGGMLFEPFNRNPPPFPGIGIPGRLPPGAIPPGARFDPFGPQNIDPQNPRRNVPDADHLPPPGYDDMFM